MNKFNKKELGFLNKKDEHYEANKLKKKALDLIKSGKIKEVKEVYKKQIELGYADYQTYANLAAICWMNGEYKNVKQLVKIALELKPNDSGALNTLGNILDREGKTKDAIIAFAKSIKFDPNNYNALYNLANSNSKLGNDSDAIILYKKSIDINPNFTQSYNNLAKIYEKLCDFKKAEKYYSKSIEINQNFCEGYNNLGNIQQSKGLLNEAKSLYLKAININPYLDDAIYNLGNVFKKEKNYIQAIEYYKKAINLNQSNTNAKLELISVLAFICDWDQIDEYKRWIKEIGISDKAISPLALLHLDQDPKRHFQRAQNFWKKRYKRNQIHRQFQRKEKIHIGYFSADFRTHPVSMLITRILELQDKNKFKTFAYSLDPKRINDKYTRRIKSATNTFRDLSELNEEEVLDLVKQDDLDIAIDLMGYTDNNRHQIFSYRLAKIQVNYLGYPGTTGSDIMDYILADKIIIPPNSTQNYSEKVIYMPNCFMCFDNTIKISNKKFTKKEVNLYENKFIFTAFHKSQKITREVFNIWIKILHKVPDSILWLSDMNSQAKSNIKKEFIDQGIEEKRLVFSKKTSSYEEYLAKYNCGDLFLDTFNYNAHSTGIECLWSGLPILTLSGDSYPAKVGESLLKNFGLNELITYSKEEYTALAIKLGNNPKICKQIKDKIKSEKHNNILFNSEEFTYDFEMLLINLLNNSSI